MGKLFGTDGIRARANSYPMTPETAVKIGRAVANHFPSAKTGCAKIVIGKDTRISGDMLESALVAGICATGGTAAVAGVLPTPAVAFMTANTDATAGIVISASHNPYYDNGIKIFDQNGFKLTDAVESEIERTCLDHDFPGADGVYRQPGNILHLNGAGIKYIRFLAETLPDNYNIKGMKIVLDSSNGATYQVAPALFGSLGADVTPLFVHPDGLNINAECGSQHPQQLIQTVLDEHADIGLAFDGDGDRLIAVDEKGVVVTGDQIMAVCAYVMKKTGRLKNNQVISTVMSNMGLKIALKQMDIDLKTTQVGDRYVLAEMIATGAVIGGEDSGHMIFLDHNTTGDGMLTALKLLEAMQLEGQPLSKLARIMKVFPQELINVEVKSKPEIETVPEIMAAVKEVEKNLGEKGRVLVRYSGTQPLCRIMVEGPTVDKTKRHCRYIADIVEISIG